VSEPTTQTLRRIKESAKFRIQGESWRQIAQRYQYSSEDSARAMLTQEHPEEWRRAYEAARKRLLDEVEIGAVSRQIELSEQSDNLAIAQAATHSLLVHCAKLRAQQIAVTATVSAGPPVDYAALTPQQLEARARVLLGAGDKETSQS